MKYKKKKSEPSLQAQRLRLAIATATAQRRRQGRPSSPPRNTISAAPSTLHHRKVSSHYTGASTSRSQQSVDSPSPPRTITASRRPRVTPSSPLVRGGYEYYGSRGRGVRRGMKRDRVTRDLPTPTQAPRSMSPVANSSRVVDANEEMPDTGGVRRGMKRGRVTRDLPTPTQSPRSMSPVANSSRVVDANEEMPDTGDQESSTRKRGPRGVNLNKNIPADSSQRKVIHIDISGLNYLEHEAVRAITKDFKALFWGKETQWHQLDKDLVDMFYKSFQDRYQYEDNVDPEIARDVWEERAKRRFRGLWGAVRRNCKKKTSSTNPAHWRLICPEFVDKEDWDGILASWMTEKWRKRSDAGIANRKKVPGDDEGSYVRHTGGCVSFEIHRTRWETELGTTLTDIEFFEKLHKKEKGKGGWCDLRAERAATKYRDIVKKKNGVEDIVRIPFDDEAWAEATYFTKKNKGYGFGLAKQAQRIFRKAKRTALKRSRTYTSRTSNCTCEARIESEVTARVEIRMKAFEIEMTQRVEEQVQLQVQEQIKKFLAGLQIQAPNLTN